MRSIYGLRSKGVYVVTKPFADYYGNTYAAGERLTFVEKHFLPHPGGHSICFKECNIYLQEDDNADILDSLGDYLAQFSEDEA